RLHHRAAAREVIPKSCRSQRSDKQDLPMNEDPRCCGSGIRIIDTEGRCWCGQQWDGEKMGSPALGRSAATTTPETKAE
ncbi:MAG: hypothetical protein EBY28_21610, partial [Betaproteobacteria bacterium]|nr:hypothetical protein [Betaproteobacteria bacterium]